MKKFVLVALAALGFVAATPMLAAAAATSFSESTGGVQGGSTG